jgi:hypothetical protein
VEFPLPAPTWLGLKVHVANAGRFEQAKVIFQGNVPAEGFTVNVYVVDFPTGTEADCGLTPMLKSNAEAGRTVNDTAAECASEAESLPSPFTVNA